MTSPNLRADEPQALMIDGTRLQASLVSLANEQLTLQTGMELRTLALTELIHWQRPHQSTAPPGLLLVDGSFLALLSTTNLQLLSETRLIINSPIWGAVDLPWPRVRAIITSRPANRQEAMRLQDELMSVKGVSDQLWLDNGDRLAGKLVSLGNHGVVFRLAQRELTLGLERVRAILPDPSLRETQTDSEVSVLVGLSDGSQLRSEVVEFDERSLQIQCMSDVILETDPDLSPTGPADIVLLQPLGGRVVYLSDREPLDYLHIPYLAVRWPYGRDRNLFGDRLCVRNTEYPKGLGMHSTSRLAYSLENGDLRFDALLAIDDSAGQGGSVVFRVFLDLEESWRPVFESPTIRGGDPPHRCSIDLTGASRIALVVDFADRADELDHANWLDARILRSDSPPERNVNRTTDQNRQDN